MTEDVLHYIWKTQSFNLSNLTSVKGDSIRIIHAGRHNEDSGPDFSASRILINNVEWVGDVEIHVKTSLWNTHRHQHDPAYNKVILHIVLHNDADIYREDGTEIPTLELEKLVSEKFLTKYKMIMESLDSIICKPFFGDVDYISKLSTYNKVLVERLERRSESILVSLDALKGDWEQVSLHLLFEYFGFKKNNEAFKHLAGIMDYKILAKLKSLEEVEAYLFGVAGFLVGAGKENNYFINLQNKFIWLIRKLNISVSPMALTWWKFMRMRPANFPTLRIAQLAALIFEKKHLFKSLIEVLPKDATIFFSTQTSSFWKNHYHFNKKTESSLKGIGGQSSRSLGINVAAPLLMAYGIYMTDDHFKLKAITFLEVQKPEENVIIRRWNSLGVNFANAAETQGAIELFNNYCIKHRCLKCSIGHKILGS